MFKTIKSRILVLQTGLILFAVIAIGLAGYLITFNFYIKCLEQNLEYKAATISRDLEVIIENRKPLLERISNSEEVINYFRRQQAKMLMEFFAKHSGQFPVLSYINQKGREEVKLVNGKQVSELSDFADSDIFRQAIEKPNKVFASYSADCPELGSQCVQFAYFNKSFFDEPIGVVSGMVSVQALTESIHEFRFSPVSYAILIDSNGMILAGGDKAQAPTKVTIKGKDAERIKGSLKAMASGFGRVTILGIDSYIAHTPVEGQDWQAVAAVPYSEFMGEMNVIGDVILLTGFIVLAIGVFITLFLAEKILQPSGDKNRKEV